jgi:Ca2+-binding EF-hand superfamily protein
MANKYDDNADGSIDREEWKKIVGDMMKFPKDDRKTLMKAFEKVAKGGKGAQAQISTEELVYVATK